MTIENDTPPSEHEDDRAETSAHMLQIAAFLGRNGANLDSWTPEDYLALLDQSHKDIHAHDGKKEADA